MKTFPFTKEVVERVLKEDGWDEMIKVRDNYIGRGERNMCVGFTAPEVRNVLAFVVRLAGETEAEDVELTDLVDAVGTYCTDNMGHDVIVYFPGHVLLSEEEVAEEVPSLPDDHWSKKLNPLPGLGPEELGVPDLEEGFHK